MHPFVKVIQNDTEVLLYGVLLILTTGLLSDSFVLFKNGDWFERSGALLVCFSLICVYINHYITPLQSEADEQTKKATVFQKDPELHLSAAIDSEVESRINSSLPQLIDVVKQRFGKNVSEDMVRELAVENIRAGVEEKFLTGATEHVDTIFENAANINNLSLLLVRFEFSAAIIGTFIWGFGDFKFVQLLTAIGLLCFWTRLIFLAYR